MTGDSAIVDAVAVLVLAAGGLIIVVAAVAILIRLFVRGWTDARVAPHAPREPTAGADDRDGSE